MALYAKDAAETEDAYKRWEFNKGKRWVQCITIPRWDPNTQYRRKPRTININDFEVPEPVREPLKVGDVYYLPAPTWKQYHLSQAMWTGGGNDYFYLERGLVHRTPEAAAIHGKALASFTEQTKEVAS